MDKNSKKIQFSDRVGGTSRPSCAILNVSLYLGEEKLYSKAIYGEYEFTAGWFLYKFIDEKSLGLSFDRIRIDIYTFDDNPNMFFWLDSFVIGQLSIPILCLTFDNGFNNERSDFLNFLYNNRVPFSAPSGLSGAGSDKVGLDNELYNKAYNEGLVDISIYNLAAKSKKTISEIKDYLVNKTNEEVYDYDFINSKVVSILSSENYVDDKMLAAQSDLGYTIIRASNGYRYTNYYGRKSNIVLANSFGGIVKGQIANQQYIENGIEAGKSYIDTIVKIGCIGCLINHHIVNASNLIDKDYGLAGVYEVVVPVINYALQLQKEGKLRIMNLSGLYYSTLNY